MTDKTPPASDAATDQRRAPDVSARLFEAGYLIGEERAALVAVLCVPGREPVVMLHGEGPELARGVKALKRHLQGRRVGPEHLSEVSEVSDDAP